jgi:hypothetical protein
VPCEDGCEQTNTLMLSAAHLPTSCTCSAPKMAALLAHKTFGAAPVARRASVAVPSRVRAVSVVASAKKEAQQMLKPATTALVANLLMALPAAADSGKLFDFNMTMPVVRDSGS